MATLPGDFIPRKWRLDNWDRLFPLPEQALEVKVRVIKLEEAKTQKEREYWEKELAENYPNFADTLFRRVYELVHQHAYSRTLTPEGFDRLYREFVGDLRPMTVEELIEKTAEICHTLPPG